MPTRDRLPTGQSGEGATQWQMEMGEMETTDWILSGNPTCNENGRLESTSASRSGHHLVLVGLRWAQRGK